MAATTTKSASKAPKASASKASASKPAPPTRPSPEIRRVADLLKQVSDPTRLQVLMLLNEKERNVSELCADLGTQSQPAVSHHLALLRHGRLIEPRRSGKHNFYGLTEAGRELAEVVNTIVG
jgi:DNA-binding transcriptional ArsR family regulator